MRVLSVDWDYFFPNIDWYDWGHRENRFFIEHSWYHRCGCHNIMTGDRAITTVLPDPKLRNDFWLKRVSKDPLILFISESHATMYYWLKNFTIDELVNFDQHHDLGYPSTNGVVDCGNWAGKMLKEKRIKRYTLVYPPWRKDRKDGEKIPKRKGVTIYYDANEVPRSEYDAIFICRSGAWTPSWCDEDFNKFVRLWSPHPVWKNRQISDYDPTILRSPNRVDAEHLAKQMNAKFSNLDALRRIKMQHNALKELINRDTDR